MTVPQSVLARPQLELAWSGDRGLNADTVAVTGCQRCGRGYQKQQSDQLSAVQTQNFAVKDTKICRPR